VRLIWLFLLVSGLLGATGGASSPPETDKPVILVVVGAPGEEEYGKNFEAWATLWKEASAVAGAKYLGLGLDQSETTNDHERLRQILENEPKETTAEFWMVFIGHGTFDGKEAKFNLRGPDVSATELASWLQPFKRPLAILDTASASGAFVKALSAPDRVIVTATKSGYEQNYARFGQYLSQAVADPQADLDKDGQTSLLEAFLKASHGVTEFYSTDGRLATEHALIDDNGDGLGTPADWFRGIRAVKKAVDGSSVDGLRAHQFHLVRSPQEQQMPPAVRAKRDELELAIARMRDQKSQMPEDEYYSKLEVLLLELAKLYQSAESQSSAAEKEDHTQ
jgi:hypothetical protein